MDGLGAPLYQMRVIIDCHLPFSLAHGGMQTQIEQTKIYLEKIGVKADYLRWWDDKQTGDILHFFGRMPVNLVPLVKEKGMKVVMSDLLTAQGSRSGWRVSTQQIGQRIVQNLFPNIIRHHFNWDAYQLADACVVLTPWEAELLVRLYGAPRHRIHVVPNGVETAFLESRPSKRGPWLVCTATITERKRVLELAQAAVAAHTPLWVLGKAYSAGEPYARRFAELARIRADILRFEGPIGDRARLAGVYREARGFVLLSAMESLSLSALEAAACECPLLLSDLPWARTVFGEDCRYCPVTSSINRTAASLRKFYEDAPTVKPPRKPLPWTDVVPLLKDIYERVLSTSR
jgi:glycosyltransferase involved in cell wall biosynthesis